MEQYSLEEIEEEEAIIIQLYCECEYSPLDVIIKKPATQEIIGMTVDDAIISALNQFQQQCYNNEDHNMQKKNDERYCKEKNLVERLKKLTNSKKYACIINGHTLSSLPKSEHPSSEYPTPITTLFNNKEYLIPKLARDETKFLKAKIRIGDKLNDVHVDGAPGLGWYLRQSIYGVINRWKKK